MRVIATVKDIATAKLLMSECPPDFFRVNSSHMEVPALRAFVDSYSRDASLSRLPLYVDLQGSKLRVHRRQPPLELRPDTDVPILSTPDDAPDPLPASCMSVPPRVLSLVGPGTLVAIDDGKMQVSVSSVDLAAGRAVARVVRGGTLLPGKGFNLRPHPVAHSELSARDVDVVRATRDHEFVRYALSFAALASEVQELKRVSGGRRVAVKIERPLTDQQTVDLCREAGEAWVCRGDMGVQMGGLGELAKWYRSFTVDLLPRLRELPCDVVMAGEVLEHMCQHPEPTRSEACHLADLWCAGYRTIVVSNETAVGQHPVEVLKQFRAISSVVQDLDVGRS